MAALASGWRRHWPNPVPISAYGVKTKKKKAAAENLDHLTTVPDLLIFDGQGFAHPRRCGLASHLGVLLDMPSIGCAKTGLWGRYEEPHTEKGSYSYLMDGDETIGAVVRTRSEVKPLFVSIGHRINLHDSITIVLRCCPRYRLPETTRRADKLARSKLIGCAITNQPSSPDTWNALINFRSI